MTADRTSYCAGLRTLADLLEQHDELPIPNSGEMTFHYLCEQDPKARLAEFARIMPGPLTKVAWGGTSVDTPDYFDLRGTIEGVRVTATAFRSKVCTRVVTGTREVTEEVPDPDALAAVPTLTVTRTEDVIEWDCGPILTARTREQEMVDAQNDGFLDNAEPDVPGADDYLADVTA